MSGERVTFIGDAMAVVVQGILEVRTHLGKPPTIVGGLAVLSRLSTPYRATVDLDVVDRLRDGVPHLEVLRAATGAQVEEPSGVLLPTTYGRVKVDVLEVRQAELDLPSDDPGDRLHTAAHAWAYDTATELTLDVQLASGQRIEATAPVAEPGPLIAMKLQAVMDRGQEKQGTDLLDIVRLTMDPATQIRAFDQIRIIEDQVAQDVALHVDHWFNRNRRETLQRIRAVGGLDITADDLALVAELLLAAAERPH